MNISRRFFICTTALVALVPVTASAGCGGGNTYSGVTNLDAAGSTINKFSKTVFITAGAFVGVAAGLAVVGGVVASPAILAGLGIAVVAGAVVGAITYSVVKTPKKLNTPYARKAGSACSISDAGTMEAHR